MTNGNLMVKGAEMVPEFAMTIGQTVENFMARKGEGFSAQAAVLGMLLTTAEMAMDDLKDLPDQAIIESFEELMVRFKRHFGDLILEYREQENMNQNDFLTGLPAEIIEAIKTGKVRAYVIG